MLYLFVITNTCYLFVLIGSLSDRYSRKWFLLIPLLAFALASISNLLITLIWPSHYEFVIFSEFISGIGGFFASSITLCTAYLVSHCDLIALHRRCEKEAAVAALKLAVPFGLQVPRPDTAQIALQPADEQTPLLTQTTTAASNSAMSGSPRSTRMAILSGFLYAGNAVGYAVVGALLSFFSSYLRLDFKQSLSALYCISCVTCVSNALYVVFLLPPVPISFSVRTSAPATVGGSSNPSSSGMSLHQHWLLSPLVHLTGTFRVLFERRPGCTRAQLLLVSSANILLFLVEMSGYVDFLYMTAPPRCAHYLVKYIKGHGGVGCRSKEYSRLYIHQRIWWCWLPLQRVQ